MKYLFIIILILRFSFASNAQKLQDVEAFFKPKQTFSNSVTAKTYFLENSLKCSNTIILNSDSTFLREIGREGHSFVTVENWRQFKDSIELKAVKQASSRIFDLGNSGFFVSYKISLALCQRRVIANAHYLKTFSDLYNQVTN